MNIKSIDLVLLNSKTEAYRLSFNDDDGNTLLNLYLKKQEFLNLLQPISKAIGEETFLMRDLDDFIDEFDASNQAFMWNRAHFEQEFEKYLKRL